MASDFSSAEIHLGMGGSFLSASRPSTSQKTRPGGHIALARRHQWSRPTTTPIGLPAEWPVLIDRCVTATAIVVLGSGVRRSKILVPGSLLGRLPHVEIVDGMAA